MNYSEMTFEERRNDCRAWYEYGFTYSIEFAHDHGYNNEELRDFLEGQVRLMTEVDENFVSENYPDIEFFIQEMTDYLVEKYYEKEIDIMITEQGGDK